MNDGDRERIIRDAVQLAISKNIRIVRSSWGIEWSKSKERWVVKKDQRCCALGCVILELQNKVPLSNVRDWRSLTIETLLHCDTEWIRSFQRGFDKHSKLISDDFAYELGLLMGDELVKEVQLKIPGT